MGLSTESEWNDHLSTCHRCGDWFQAQAVEKRGFRAARFPCVHIAYRVTEPCDRHTPEECPDVLVLRAGRGYGLPVRDGGGSVVRIGFCPWCGISLQAKRRKPPKSPVTRKQAPTMKPAKKR
jgi:hypothetical protein